MREYYKNSVLVRIIPFGKTVGREVQLVCCGTATWGGDRDLACQWNELSDVPPHRPIIAHSFRCNPAQIIGQTVKTSGNSYTFLRRMNLKKVKN